MGEMDKRQAWYEGWVVMKDFPGHEGRPGEVGGSVPRGATPVKVELPPDMSKWSKKQHREAIDALAKQPLKELRRRQDLVASQRKSVFQQLEKVKDPVEKDRLERGLRNLDIMDQHLIAAVDKREFG